MKKWYKYEIASVSRDLIYQNIYPLRDVAFDADDVILIFKLHRRTRRMPRSSIHSLKI